MPAWPPALRTGSYPQRGLRRDPAEYQIGAGTGVRVETDFADARLEVSDEGMHAAPLFTDADGAGSRSASTTRAGAVAGAADFSRR